MKRLSLAGAWVVGWAVHLRRIVWFCKAAFVRPAVMTGNASREKCAFGVVGGDTGMVGTRQPTPTRGPSNAVG